MHTKKHLERTRFNRPFRELPVNAIFSGSKPGYASAERFVKIQQKVDPNSPMKGKVVNAKKVVSQGEKESYEFFPGHTLVVWFK